MDLDANDFDGAQRILGTATGERPGEERDLSASGNAQDRWVQRNQFFSLF
jgi:hypothetical protein